MQFFFKFMKQICFQLSVPSYFIGAWNYEIWGRSLNRKDHQTVVRNIILKHMYILKVPILKNILFCKDFFKINFLHPIRLLFMVVHCDLLCHPKDYVLHLCEWWDMYYYHFPLKLRPCSLKNTWIDLVFIFLMRVMWGFTKIAYEYWTQLSNDSLCTATFRWCNMVSKRKQALILLSRAACLSAGCH